MSNDKAREALPFLLSDDAIGAYADNWNEGVRGITFAHRTILVEGMDRARTIYEAARQRDKDRIEELTGLVQELVDALTITRLSAVTIAHEVEDGVEDLGRWPLSKALERGMSVIDRAKQLGFTPKP